jgi:hypothetical protein
MNTTDIMKNPAFTPILFEIERRILASVRAAKADCIDLNDSQIRSMLNKVRKTAGGGKPQVPDMTEGRAINRNLSLPFPPPSGNLPP